MSEPIYVARWHGPEGNFTVLVKRGRTQLHLCVQDYPVRVVHLPLNEAHHVTALNYNTRRAARKFRAFCKHGNATQAALRLIEEALT